MEDPIPSMKHENETAVSEIVGAIMLISLVVIAVAIIAMVLFSQPGPREIPNVNFMVGSDGNSPPRALYLFHNGGDDLRVGDFQVILDGVSKPYTIEGGGEYWSLGKRLDVDISTMATLPEQVTLVYNSTAGDSTAIRSASIDLSVTPGVIKPDVRITPTPTPEPEMKVKEIFYRNYSRVSRPSTNADYSYYMDIAVGPSAQNSWITASCRTTSATRTIYPLVSGNRLNITMRTGTTNLRMFGHNNRIWNISGSVVSVGIYTQYTPAIGSWYSIFNTGSGRNIYDASIDDCYAYGSTISIINTTSAQQVPTTLVVNNTIRIQGFDNNYIVINKPIPTNPGIFVLDWNTANNVVFMGFANDTKVNGAECNNWYCTGLPS